jgi:hypothetical protein
VTFLWGQRHAPGLALNVLLRQPPLGICTCQPGQLRLPGGRIDGTLLTWWSIGRDWVPASRLLHDSTRQRPKGGPVKMLLVAARATSGIFRIALTSLVILILAFNDLS